MYLNAIEQGDRFLKSNTLRNEQLNAEAHSFWIVYFKSLLAVGHYETVIDYIDCFEDDEINYYIALALYNKGVPLQALDILKKIVRQNNQNIGYIYNLMSSIYDWIGDNKKSQKCFSRALKNCCDDNDLKFQLFKK